METSSFSLSLNEIEGGLDEANLALQAIKEYEGAMQGNPATEAQVVCDMFSNLQDFFTGLQVPQEGLEKKGAFIWDFLQAAGISASNYQQTISFLESTQNIANLAKQSKNKSDTFSPMGKLLEALKKIFTNIDNFEESYSIHIGYDQKGHIGTVLTMHCWCFNAGCAMQNLTRCGVRNIILASGTLSPMDSFAYELGISFPVTLENGHVIKPSQLMIGALSLGPSGKNLNSSFKTRTTDYQIELGNALVNFARIIPDGLLVFFPSYELLKICSMTWKTLSEKHTSTIWERIEAIKPIITEPREVAQFGQAISDFYQKLDDPSFKGAIFLAVCRGKASEGIDFSDRNGRAVIITGLPYPSLKDTKVQYQKKFLDNSPGKLTGFDWYQQQSSRAVNQAIGRVIRHKDDYGAIILADQRFQVRRNINQLSAWLRPHLKIFNNFGEVSRAIALFFKEKSNDKNNNNNENKNNNNENNKNNNNENKNENNKNNNNNNENNKNNNNNENKNYNDSDINCQDINMQAKTKNPVSENPKEPVTHPHRPKPNPRTSNVHNQENVHEAKKQGTQFLDQLKRSLSKEQHRRLSELMKPMHQSRHHLETALDGIIQLFFSTNDAAALIKGFEQFLGPSNRKQWLQRLRIFTDTNSQIKSSPLLNQNNNNNQIVNNNNGIGNNNNEIGNNNNQIVNNNEIVNNNNEIRNNNNEIGNNNNHIVNNNQIVNNNNAIVNNNQISKNHQHVNNNENSVHTSRRRLPQWDRMTLETIPLGPGSAQQPLFIEDSNEANPTTDSLSQQTKKIKHEQQPVIDLANSLGPTSPERDSLEFGSSQTGSQNVDLLTGAKRTFGPKRRLVKTQKTSDSQDQSTAGAAPADVGSFGVVMDDRCPICLSESISQPHIAKCKHVCCLECWQQTLLVKLECPLCKRKTRLKHLEPHF